MKRTILNPSYCIWTAFYYLTIYTILCGYGAMAIRQIFTKSQQNILEIKTNHIEPMPRVIVEYPRPQ